MIDANGWIRIFIDDDGEIGNETHDRFFEEIDPVISDFNKYDNQFIELKKMNVSEVYYIGLAHNHSSNYLDDLIALYKTIGKKAPLSYGLLYVYDDEDQKRFNKYRVFRLAKGAFTEHEDTLFSPYFPIIEDPID